MDFSEYKGVEARVSSFMLSHRFLVVELDPAPSSGLAQKYILCYFCKVLPHSITWIVDDLRIHELEERHWLVMDWKPGIAIPCEYVESRDQFDLRQYLAVGDP
jgi:hypothetical protein